jgi:hypothetical protein
MKYACFFFLCLAGIAACRQPEQPKPRAPISLKVDTAIILKSDNGKVIQLFNDYIIPDTAGQLLVFPLNLAGTDNDRSSVSKKYGNGSAAWNYLFYHIQTDTSHLLTDRRLLFTGYHPLNNRFTLYTVTAEDYNQNNLLDEGDPTYLFISDRYGQGFRQLTPPYTHVMGWKYWNNKDLLLVKCIEDNNTDRVYNDKDEQVYFRINLNDTAFTCRELFTTADKLHIKAQFDSTWKQELPDNR